MKRINVFLALAVALTLGGVFSACEQQSMVKNVTVKFFDPLGEISPAPVTLEQGQSLGGSLPAGPADAVVNGVTYYFYGWFDGATEYDDGTPVGADITLTAKWNQQAPDYITVTFQFTQTDGGNVIQPTAKVSPVKVIKGKKLGVSQLPVTPRSKGWVFDAWQYNNSPFDLNTALNNNITLTAAWIAAGTFTVTFNSGTGGAPVSPIVVYQGECIDEWEARFPPPLAGNTVNTKAFFVAWLDDENREYDGRVPISRNVTLDARWGLPPYIVNFKTDIDETGLVGSTDEAYGNVDYLPKVREAWDSTAANPKWVIVNETTYDAPYNTNRWRILYRVKMSLGSFNVGFYTRYTIRARFYANKQGTKSPPDANAFTPNNPANASGYSANGLLKGGSSPSDDGWGQISWTITANWDGQGADANTMLQRYNLDRKGGTINDTWAPLNGKTQPWPPYLLIQTSDNYIGHIEITQIVFHNGEKKYTMYEDEEGYDEAEDGLD